MNKEKTTTINDQRHQETMKTAPQKQKKSENQTETNQKTQEPRKNKA